MGKLLTPGLIRCIGLLLLMVFTLGATLFALGSFLTVSSAPGWTAPANIGHTTYGSYEPEIVLDSQGYTHAVWWGNGETESDRVIWYANNRSGTWSTPKRISPQTECRAPKIAITPDDALHVVYVDWVSSQIMHTYSTDYGGSWSARQNISLSSKKAYEPDITADAEGGIHAVWIDSRWIGGSYYQATYAYRPSSTWSDPVRVQRSVGFNKAPRVITTGTGDDLRVHVTFYGKSSDADPNYMYETYYVQETGTSWEAVQNLSNSATRSSYNPDIAAGESNALYVVWDENPPESYHDIFLKRSTDNGATWPITVTIVVNPSLSRFPALAYDQDNLQIGYDDDMAGDGDIFYSTYDPVSNQVSSPLNLSATSGESSQVDIGANDCRVGTIWQDRIASGNPLDIYYSTTPTTPPGPCPGIPPEGTVSIIAQAPAGSLGYTRQLAVNLDLFATAATGYSVAWMRYANQADFQDHPDWVPYTTTVGSWTLASGQNCETKQVFAQFRDNASPPQDSEVVNDQIFYDNYLAADMVLNEGMSWTNSTMVMVNSTDVDAAAGCSGLETMAAWETGLTQTTWISYSPALYFQLDAQGPVTRTVYVTYRDRAGNEGTYSDSIVLDTTPPTGTAPLVNNGEPTAQWIVPVSELVATDTAGIANVWLANAAEGPWMAFTYCSNPPCTYTWNLAYGGPPVQAPDLHYVYVKYEDRTGYGGFPGNFSPVYAGSVLVNGTFAHVYLPIVLNGP
jgi:hypothetical protein